MKTNLRKWLPKKMWTRMAIALSILVTIPLVVLGFLLINSSQVAVKTSVLRDQEQLAIRTAGQLSEFVKRPKELLISTAQILGALHTDIWRQETALVQLALQNEIFECVWLLDLKGKGLATSRLGMPSKDYSNDPAFEVASQGKFYLSDVYISETYEPHVRMSVPIKQLGKVTAVLLAEVSLRDFWKIVDEIRIGQTGRAYVVSQDGILIADQDKKRVLANEDVSSQVGVRQVMQGYTGSREVVDANGKKWLKAYAPIPSLGWGVIVRQSADEAYSFLHLMKIESWVLIVFSWIVVVFVSIFLAKFLVHPIRLLAEKMSLVSKGDFDQRLEVAGSDELGNLMNAFNKMTDKLKIARESEKLAVIGKAATAIAHELKNSLVMAGTYIGLLPKRYADKNFIEKFSRVLPQELESWKNMLQDISDFSKKSNIERSVVCVKALLEDLVLLIEHRLDQHRVTLEFQAPEVLCSILGHRQKLKQALMNLAINALEAMPEGGKLSLEVKTKTIQTPKGPASEIFIYLKDTGRGMSEDKLEKIFKPFYTTKPNGLGLGLTICKEIIEQHEGRLEVASQEKVGTIFTVIIPAEKEDAKPDQLIASYANAQN